MSLKVGSTVLWILTERSFSELEKSRKFSKMFHLLMFILAIARVKVNVSQIVRVECHSKICLTQKVIVQIQNNFAWNEANGGC